MTERSIAWRSQKALSANTHAIPIIVVFMLFAFQGCGDSNGPDLEKKYAPTAAFSFDPASGFTPPLAVQFTDESDHNPTQWNWEFGDGGVSTDRNPEHIYTTVGKFTVTLIVSNSAGRDTLIKEECIYIGTAPNASFTKDKNTGAHPLLVTFTNTTTGTYETCEWNFGDGSTLTSCASQVTHTYQSAGTFSVTLTVRGIHGDDTADPQAIYVANPEQDVTLSSRTLGKVYAIHTGSGDRNFNGHGPSTTITGAISINSETSLRFAMYIYARETVSDWTTGEGYRNDFVISDFVPAGWRIKQILVPSNQCDFTFTCPSAEAPVIRTDCASWLTFRIIGNTDGDDVCPQGSSQSGMQQYGDAYTNVQATLTGVRVRLYQP